MPAPSMQKKPTPWMVVAIAQSALWFFGMPVLCKSMWGHLFGDELLVSGTFREILLNFIAGFVFFATYCACVLPVYYLNLPFFEQYKISDKPWAWRSDNKKTRDEFWDLHARSVKLVIFNLLIVIPIITYCKHEFFPSLTPNFSLENWPSQLDMLIDNIELSIIHEFFFYWTHRIMHHPTLYRWHKIHHEYKQNTVLAAQHNHPLDYLLSIGGPAVLATMVVTPHSVVQLQWAAWVVYANCDDHVGYSFPWSPVRWFPFANLTEQHEFHHSVNMGCFASKLNIYDKLFDSERKYLDWSEKRRKAWCKQT